MAYKHYKDVIFDKMLDLEINWRPLLRTFNSEERGIIQRAGGLKRCCNQLGILTLKEYDKQLTSGYNKRIKHKKVKRIIN